MAYFLKTAGAGRFWQTGAKNTKQTYGTQTW